MSNFESELNNILNETNEKIINLHLKYRNEVKSTKTFKKPSTKINLNIKKCEIIDIIDTPNNIQPENVVDINLICSNVSSSVKLLVNPLENDISTIKQLSLSNKLDNKLETRMDDISVKLENLANTTKLIEKFFGKDTSSYERGALGEVVIINHIKNLYPSAQVIDVSKISHSGDIKFVDGNIECIIEIKNKKKLLTADLDKFYDDVKNNTYNSGLFISLVDDNFPKKGKRFIVENVSNKPCILCFLENIGQLDICMKYISHTISNSSVINESQNKLLMVQDYKDMCKTSIENFINHLTKDIQAAKSHLTKLNKQKLEAENYLIEYQRLLDKESIITRTDSNDSDDDIKTELTNISYLKLELEVLFKSLYDVDEDTFNEQKDSIFEIYKNNDLVDDENDKIIEYLKECDIPSNQHMQIIDHMSRIYLYEILQQFENELAVEYGKQPRVGYKRIKEIIGDDNYNWIKKRYGSVTKCLAELFIVVDVS